MPFNGLSAAAAQTCLYQPEPDLLGSHVLGFGAERDIVSFGGTAAAGGWRRLFLWSETARPPSWLLQVRRP